MTSDRFMLRSAVYLMPIKDQQILLLRRFNTGWMDGHYSLIAGHLNGNESITQAMIREAHEEAKIKITNSQLIPATALHRKAVDLEYIDFFFVVEQWDGIPTIGEPNKCDELDWFKMDDLPINTLPYIKEAINNYKNHVPFSESGWE